MKTFDIIQIIDMCIAAEKITGKLYKTKSVQLIIAEYEGAKGLLTVLRSQCPKYYRSLMRYANLRGTMDQMMDSGFSSVQISLANFDVHKFYK